MSRTIPRVLLGTRSLHGLSLATRDRVLKAGERYREPEALAVTFSRALDANADGVLASPTGLFGETVTVLRRAVPIHAVIPGISEVERLELPPGIEPLVGRRAPRGGPGVRGRIAYAHFTRPAWLYGGDWTKRLPIVMESELAGVRRRDLHGVVLDAWLVDCALAVGNRKFLEAFLGLARKRFRVLAGLETHNLGLMVARLGEWGWAPDYVVAPVNDDGLGMTPDRDAALQALANCPAPVLAKELCAGGADFEGAAAFAREHGAHGLVADLCELEDAGFELKAVG